MMDPLGSVPRSDPSNSTARPFAFWRLLREPGELLLMLRFPMDAPGNGTSQKLNPVGIHALINSYIFVI